MTFYTDSDVSLHVFIKAAFGAVASVILHHQQTKKA
jgi:hypothetical protein